MRNMPAGYVDDIRSLVEEIGEEALKFYGDLQPERARDLLLRSEWLAVLLRRYLGTFRPCNSKTKMPDSVRIGEKVLRRHAD